MANTAQLKTKNTDFEQHIKISRVNITTVSWQFFLVPEYNSVTQELLEKKNMAQKTEKSAFFREPLRSLILQFRNLIRSRHSFYRLHDFLHRKAAR